MICDRWGWWLTIRADAAPTDVCGPLVENRTLVLLRESVSNVDRVSSISGDSAKTATRAVVDRYTGVWYHML